MFRVIWQYDKSVIGFLDSEVIRPAPLDSLIQEERGSEEFSIIGSPEPVFSRPPLALRSGLLAMPQDYQQDPINDLAGYYHAFVNTNEEAKALKNSLLGQPSIIYSEIQGEIQEPYIVDETRNKAISETYIEELSLFPKDTRDFTPLQIYLSPSPDGVDAYYSWQLPSGKGEGVRIVDIEKGWNFQHEDLRLNQTGIIYGVNKEEHDHGTAVIGIFSGDDNEYGVTGIAPNALVSGASTIYDREQGKWNAANAIIVAADRLNAGDIILLEMQAPGPNYGAPWSQKGFIAIEYWQSEFAAIKYATQKGIYVVEAAGNGDEDYDHPIYDNLFSRSYRDSGAIFVGAGASALQEDARTRMDYSNYGSRLDVQAWGEDIVTTGGRSHPRYYDLQEHPEPSRCYMKDFAGTSGAAPIVVGVVAVISGLLKANGIPPLSPFEMRDLIVKTGTPQLGSDSSPVEKAIGPLPCIRKTIELLNTTYSEFS